MACPDVRLRDSMRSLGRTIGIELALARHLRTSKSHRSNRERLRVRAFVERYSQVHGAEELTHQCTTIAKLELRVSAFGPTT